jgi:hypothetical protein
MIALFMLSATGANAQSKLRYTDCAGNSTVIDAYTTEARDGLPLTKGKTIFNISTQKVETCNGNRWVGAGDPPEEEILFTINTTDGKYYIPTSGQVGGTYNHAYKWDISVDNVVVKTNETGIGSYSSNGIELTGMSNGEHQIRITPADSPAPGWGNAFGHYSSTSGANHPDNKKKLISIDAPLTTLAFSPEAPDGVTVTNASNMFAYIFWGCTNLTNPAKIVDTYQLPEEITDLSGFLNQTHYNNYFLASPIDLSGLEGWLDKNTSIKNLSWFLDNTHSYNTKLASPIDLSHLSGWFSNNTSITNLSYFLSYTHSGNANLKTPIDLEPLKDWFNGNESITDLSNFLSATHSGNTSLDLKGQTIFPDWIKTLKQGTAETPIKDVSGAFERMFSCEQEKSGDTGEPTFENGDPLSSLGEPNYNRQTYTNRNISPVNDGWK